MKLRTLSEQRDMLLEISATFCASNRSNRNAFYVNVTEMVVVVTHCKHRSVGDAVGFRAPGLLSECHRVRVSQI